MMQASSELSVLAPAEDRPAKTAADTAAWSIEIVEDLRRAETLWLSFEAVAATSPYQRFEWVRSYVEAFSGPDAFEARVAVVRSPSGAVLMLVPLALSRRGGLRIAEGIGGKQANYHCPLLVRGGFGVATPEEARKLLAALGRALRADAFAFENMPLSWQGEPNPFALAGASPSPSNAYKLTLSADPEDTLKRTGSSESRRKLRKKESALGRVAPLTYRVASTPEEVDQILDAFYRQKAERFAALGIRNPFDDPAAHRFVRDSALTGLAQGLPAIELHGLWLGEQVIATYGGGVDDERFSCMFNSFDGNPDLARHSPGDLLLLRVIRGQCERGRRVLDLGVGEARYKSAVCDEIEELVDLFHPVSLKGRAYVVMRERLSALKRRIKQTPWAWRMVGTLRAAKAKIGG